MQTHICIYCTKATTININDTHEIQIPRSTEHGICGKALAHYKRAKHHYASTTHEIQIPCNTEREIRGRGSSRYEKKTAWLQKSPPFRPLFFLVHQVPDQLPE